MKIYKTCPYCGASLDPGEICDCLDILSDVAMPFVRDAKRRKDKETAPSVTSTESGKDPKVTETH